MRARVGIRELRQSASQLLRRVAHGETIEITDHGQPVALLTPLPQGGLLDRMRAAGEIDSAAVDLDELPPPLAPRTDEPLPSAVLERLRSDER